MEISTVETGFFKLDGGAMFGVVPKKIWNKLNPADENNLCTWAMRCLLVRHDDRLILIDTGIGDKQDEKFFAHYELHGDKTLIGSLAEQGVKPEDITDVFLTHLHFDHVGGAISRVDGKLVTTFPNAKYWSSERHWNWASHPNARERASFLMDNIAPLKDSDQLYFVESEDMKPFGNGFEIIFVDGHTERMMLPLLNVSGKKYLFCADLMPSMAHVAVPYVMGYDMRPLITVREKEFILRRCALENITLIFQHDPNIEACTVVHGEKGIRAGDPVVIGSF